MQLTPIHVDACSHPGCMSIQFTHRLARQTRRKVRQYIDSYKSPEGTIQMVEHYHDPNSYTDIFTCSNGHVNSTTRYTPCLASRCMFNVAEDLTQQVADGRHGWHGSMRRVRQDMMR